MAATSFASSPAFATSSSRLIPISSMWRAIGFIFLLCQLYRLSKRRATRNIEARSVRGIVRGLRHEIPFCPVGHHPPSSGDHSLHPPPAGYILAFYHHFPGSTGCRCLHFYGSCSGSRAVAPVV